MALVGGQVRVALDGQKIEPTAVVIEMGDTYTSRLDLYFAAKV